MVLLWMHAGAPLLLRGIQYGVPIAIVVDTTGGAPAYIHAETVWYCYGCMLARPSCIGWGHLQAIVADTTRVAPA